MKTYLLALCGIIASISALGQGTITGTVTDKANGDILLGATIMIEPGGTGVMSDFDGNYTLSGLVPGTYTIIVVSSRTIQKRNRSPSQATKRST